jgi:hypothetical protein
MTELEEIQDSLVGLLVGKDKMLTIVASLSIAATTAHMIGLPKLEIQGMLMRMYDKRVAEAKAKEGVQ